MRTTTAAERTAVSGSTLDCYAKLEIQSPDLAWVDVSTGLNASYDWLNSAQLSEHIDANTVAFSAELLREIAGTTLSLAPLLTSSTLNRDGAGAYSQMLDLARQWRVSTAVVPRGQAVVAGDWKELNNGYIDTIDVGDSNSATVTITGRGLEAPIIDTEILTLRTYSVGSGDSMETVIQALLNDNMASPPTIYVPTAMGFVINEYEQGYGSLMSAIAAVAALNGAVIRYFYDGSNVNRLTLFIPRRDAAVGSEDWTIDYNEYLSLPLNRLDISGVRNYVQVRYLDNNTGLQATVISPTSGTSASITRYGQRSIAIDLSEDTQITTSTRAQALADAVRADLETPPLLQRLETFGFWFVQLYDFGKILPNNVNY